MLSISCFFLLAMLLMSFHAKHIELCILQICVWCWHQIVNMAEKDTSKEKCPACRQPYEKERIARMLAIGER